MTEQSNNTNYTSKIWQKVKKQLRLKTLLGLALGAAGGYLYYYFIGCQSGSCPITSNPWSSIFYGSVIGLVWTIK
jgi:hypothetical protein